MLTAKENSLLSDLRSQEQLCVEKYSKYASQACDGALKNLFTAIGQSESSHLTTINQIASGTVPQVNGQQSAPAAMQPPSSPTCSPEGAANDKFLCADALAMEKHVSSTYDTCIFEFSSAQVRNVLNHIQKEEQEHGESLYKYMSQNGMYC